MSFNESQQHELGRLMASIVDGTLSPDEAQRLRAILRADPEARRYYRHYLTAHTMLERRMASLVQEHHEPAESQPPQSHALQPAEPCKPDAVQTSIEPTPTRERPQKLLEIGPLRVTRRPRPAGAQRGFSGGRLAWAAGIAAMLVMTVLLMQKPERVGQPVVDVARVTDAVGAEWVVRDAEGVELEAGVGDGLLAGRVLEVERGFVELEMGNETRVIVEGPSEIELEREALVRMQRGRLVARTNGAGETFTVVTPSASITDLGTEFGVSVDENGHTQTSVFEGLARVIGLGVESLPRVRIGEGFSATAVGEGEPVVRASDERDAYAFVRSIDAAQDGYRVRAFPESGDYVFRNTYFRGSRDGHYDMQAGRLDLTPGLLNTAGVYLNHARNTFTVGSTWAVDIRLPANPESGSYRVGMVASTKASQPGPDSEAHDRLDARGLRIRGHFRSNNAAFNLIANDTVEATGAIRGVDMGDEITLIVQRSAADEFIVYLGVRATGQLQRLAAITVPEIFEHSALHAGFEAYRNEDHRGDETATFSRWRELSDVERWSQ